MRTIEQLTNDYFIYLCAADLSSKRFRALPEQEQNELISRHKKKDRVVVERLITAIESKDIATLCGSLHKSNTFFRGVFAERTSIQLGNTESATKESIRQYVGETIYDAYWANVEIERQRCEATNLAAREKRERDSILGATCKWRLTGENYRTGTVKECIDELLSKGFVPQPGKRGFSQTAKLSNGRESFTFRKRQEVEYIMSHLSTEPAT